MSEKVMLIGGSGHAKVVIDCIRSAGDTPVGILDDGLAVGTRVLDVPVLGTTDGWKDYAGCSFVIAIGSNAVRRRLAKTVQARWYSAIHPKAVVSEYASLGQGTVVMPGAVINAGARVGDHCIVNTCAVVEHDCYLEDFVHVSPKAALGGTVTVGNGSWIGIGAAVRNNLEICGGCVIGAGAAVVKNITQPGTYVGVPAKQIAVPPREFLYTVHPGDSGISSTPSFR